MKYFGQSKDRVSTKWCYLGIIKALPPSVNTLISASNSCFMPSKMPYNETPTLFKPKGYRPRVLKQQASYFRHHAVACPLCFSLSVWFLETVRFPWLLFVVSPSSKTEGHFREQSPGLGQSLCQNPTELSHGARTRSGCKTRQHTGSNSLPFGLWHLRALWNKF